MSKKSKRVLSSDQVSITREVNYIIGRAQQHDGRVVRLYSLILFSTHTGDAWILDTEDKTALCLAREGVRQDFFVKDVADSFQIGWTCRYAITGDVFAVMDQSGNTRTLLGYPVQEILKQ